MGLIMITDKRDFIMACERVAAEVYGPITINDWNSFRSELIDFADQLWDQYMLAVNNKSGEDVCYT